MPVQTKLWAGCFAQQLFGLPLGQATQHNGRRQEGIIGKINERQVTQRGDQTKMNERFPMYVAVTNLICNSFIHQIPESSLAEGLNTGVQACWHHVQFPALAF